MFLVFFQCLGVIHHHFFLDPLHMSVVMVGKFTGAEETPANLKKTAVLRDLSGAIIVYPNGTRELQPAASLYPVTYYQHTAARSA